MVTPAVVLCHHSSVHIRTLQEDLHQISLHKVSCSSECRDKSLHFLETSVTRRVFLIKTPWMQVAATFFIVHLLNAASKAPRHLHVVANSRRRLLHSGREKPVGPAPRRGWKVLASHGREEASGHSRPTGQCQEGEKNGAGFPRGSGIGQEGRYHLQGPSLAQHIEQHLPPRCIQSHAGSAPSCTGQLVARGHSPPCWLGAGGTREEQRRVGSSPKA